MMSMYIGFILFLKSIILCLISSLSSFTSWVPSLVAYVFFTSMQDGCYILALALGVSSVWFVIAVLTFLIIS